MRVLAVREIKTGTLSLIPIAVPLPFVIPAPKVRHLLNSDTEFHRESQSATEEISLCSSVPTLCLSVFGFCSYTEFHRESQSATGDFSVQLRAHSVSLCVLLLQLHGVPRRITEWHREDFSVWLRAHSVSLCVMLLQLHRVPRRITERGHAGGF
jgi:hypothetical protein